MSDTVERDLEIAESELTAAKAELVLAERNVEEASRKIEEAVSKVQAILDKKKPDHPFRVMVTYNGVNKEFEVKADELVKSLLDAAIKKFGPINNPHTMALYNVAGEELEDVKTLKDAGVKPGDMLPLRPSKVKGGA